MQSSSRFISELQTPEYSIHDFRSNDSLRFISPAAASLALKKYPLLNSRLNPDETSVRSFLITP